MLGGWALDLSNVRIPCMYTLLIFFVVFFSCSWESAHGVLW